MVASLTGELGAGLRLGQGLGQMASQRQQQRLGAQQQELLGGLRRQGLGLGAGQRTDVRRQAAELGTDALRQLDESFAQFDAPQLARIKQDNDRLSNASDNALQFSNEELPQGLNSTANAFFRLGGASNENAARQALELAEKAKTDPNGVRAQLTALRNSSLKVGNAISNREEKIDIEIRKEERQQAKSTVNRLSKRATEVNSSFDKVMTLLDQKSRSANASVLQLIARLASPGIVTEQEAANLAGGATPLATLATAFQDGGDEDTAALIRRSIDPNNPQNFDTEGLRALAKGLTASEAPFLLEELEVAKSRAIVTGLSDKAFKANFGNTKGIDALSRFVTSDIDETDGGAAESLEGFGDLSPEDQAELRAGLANVGG